MSQAKAHGVINNGEKQLRHRAWQRAWLWALNYCFGRTVNLTVSSGSGNLMSPYSNLLTRALKSKQIPAILSLSLSSPFLSLHFVFNIQLIGQGLRRVGAHRLLQFTFCHWFIRYCTTYYCGFEKKNSLLCSSAKWDQHTRSLTQICLFLWKLIFWLLSLLKLACIIVT